jgi:hypothetical protein
LTVVVSGETEMKDDMVGEDELKLDQVIAVAPSVTVETSDDVESKRKKKKNKKKEIAVKRRRSGGHG